MVTTSPTTKLSRVAERNQRRVAADEQEWEDVDDQHEVKLEPIEPHVPLESSLSDSLHQLSSPPTTPRRRRMQTRSSGRAVFIAASTPTGRRAVYKQAKISPSTTPSIPATTLPAQPTSQQIVSQEELNSALRVGTRSTIMYTLEVLRSFFYLLKKPLAVILVIWVVAVLLNALSATVRAAVKPLCFLPGISQTSLCYDPIVYESGNGEQPQHAEYPHMMEIQSKAFDQLLDETSGGTMLSLDIKKTEMATKDLITVVRASDMRSKVLLADALDAFVGDAKETGRGLQTLNARINGAVDRILAISDYALQTIEAPESQSSLVSITKYLWPFGGLSTKPESLTHLFEQSFSVLSLELERLILTASASQTALDELEEKLSTIHAILARENISINTANDELLAELWTRLGGNRGRVARFAANLKLLKELGGYREAALARVAGALQALQALEADMEELRERASAPELTAGDVPIEVHARAIRNGVERLNDGRMRAKRVGEANTKRVLSIEHD